MLTTDTCVILRDQRKHHIKLFNNKRHKRDGKKKQKIITSEQVENTNLYGSSPIIAVKAGGLNSN